MTYRITNDLRKLLCEILARRAPGLRVFSDDGSFVAMTQVDRERAVDALSAELCESEDRPDGELTPRGVLIDRLIGYFVPYDLPMHPTRGAGDEPPWPTP